jgi:hypothetical protein
MDFINNLGFTTASQYTIVLLSAISYIYKNNKTSNQIKKTTDKDTKNKLECHRTLQIKKTTDKDTKNKLECHLALLPLYMLAKVACNCGALLFIEWLFSKN